MSSTCGNCDCADKNQCVKKGSNYTVDFVETNISNVGLEVGAADQKDCYCVNSGNCTCGSGTHLN